MGFGYVLLGIIIFGIAPIWHSLPLTCWGCPTGNRPTKCGLKNGGIGFLIMMVHAIHIPADERTHSPRERGGVRESGRESGGGAAGSIALWCHVFGARWRRVPNVRASPLPHLSFAAVGVWVPGQVSSVPELRRQLQERGCFGGSSDRR